MEPIQSTPSNPPQQPFIAPPAIKVGVNNVSMTINDTQYRVVEETMGEAFWNDIKALITATLHISAFLLNIGTIVVLCTMAYIAAVVALVAIIVSPIKYGLLALVASPFIWIASKPSWIAFVQIWNLSLYNSLSNCLDTVEWLKPTEKRQYNNLVEGLNRHRSDFSSHWDRVRLNATKIDKCLQKLQPFTDKTHKLQAEASAQGIDNPTVPLAT